MSTGDPATADELRDAQRETWEGIAEGWERRAEAVRDMGMPVSNWMIEHLALQPGHTVLELAAGPGDTGFLAAELVAPGGRLISSDGAGAMVEVARRRAERLGLRNVEHRQLELEWIDLPTASVDAILCRWGLMLAVDPEACLRECRRVLVSGGRLAVAVWDLPERNPWISLLGRALNELDLAEAPASDGPGPFTLASPARLGDLLEDAGFLDPEIEAVDVVRRFATAEEYLEENRDLSPTAAGVWPRLDEAQRLALGGRISALLADYAEPSGELRVPGRSLVAVAGA